MLLELQRRGHEVHVRTRASDVERLGALGLPSPRSTPPSRRSSSTTGRRGRTAAAQRRLLRFYERRAPLEIPDLRRALEEVGPDACSWTSSARAATTSPRRPGCRGPCTARTRRRSAPPTRRRIGLGLRPARGPLGRVRDRLLGGSATGCTRRHVAQRNAMRAGARARRRCAPRRAVAQGGPLHRVHRRAVRVPAQRLAGVGAARRARAPGSRRPSRPRGWPTRRARSCS